MIELRGACARHRPALLDFVDRAEIGTGTSSALAHLDRCGRCTEELESIVLTITALRRLGDDVARAEPAPDAWPRLRARLDRLNPRRWVIMSPSAGMVMSVALVAVLIAPLQLGTMPSSDPALQPISQVGNGLQERQAEIDYLRRSRQGTLPTSEPIFRRSGTYPRYIDGVREVRKEVHPAPPRGQPPEVI